MLPPSLLRRIPQTKPVIPSPPVVQAPVVQDAMDMSVFPEDGPDIYDPHFPNDFVEAIRVREQMQKDEKRRAERELLEQKQRNLHNLIEERLKKGLNPDGSVPSESDAYQLELAESLEEMLKRRLELTSISVQLSSFCLFLHFLISFQKSMKNIAGRVLFRKGELRRHSQKST